MLYRKILKHTFVTDRKKSERPDIGRPLWFGIFIGIVLMSGIGGVYHYTGSARFCSACHSMEHEYKAWTLSKHKQFACIECHLTDAFIFERFAYKTSAGMNDLFHEILRDYPATIRPSGKAKNIMNGNCLKCHYSTVEKTPMSKGNQNCLKCHNGLVHGRGLKRGDKN